MSKTRCRKCHKFIDSQDLICIFCGTHQQSGVHVTQFQHIQKDMCRKRQYNRLKNTMRYVAVLLFFTLIAAGVFKLYVFFNPDSKGLSGIETTLSDALKKVKSVTFETKSEIVAAPVTQINNQNVPKEIKLPLKTDSRYSTSTMHRRMSGKSANIVPRFLIPDEEKNGLHLLAYRGDSMEGTFSLIGTYSPCANGEIAVGPAINAEAMKHMPKNMRNDINRMKKNIQEAERKSTAGKNFVEFNITISGYEKNKYYLLVLSDKNGVSLASQSVMPFSDNVMVNGYGTGELEQLAWDSRDAIYPSPSTSEGRRLLIMRFANPDRCKIVSLTVDGVKYPFKIRSGNSRNFLDKKTGKYLNLKIREIDLSRAFGSKVMADFKIDGKPVSLHFTLPPPAPEFSVTVDKGYPRISWRSIKNVCAEDYVRLPEIAVIGLSGTLARYRLDDNRSSCQDLNPPSHACYSVALSGGIIKTAYWTQDTGIKETQLALMDIRKRTTSQPISINTIAESVPRPLRIALLKSDLCYENTGISGRKAMASIVDKIIAAPQMVLLDQESRKYLNERDKFKMSESLRQAFTQSSADFSVYIRDYSRQDGNGVEIWLNKNDQSRLNWWRIADIGNQSADAEKQYVAASDALYEKILALSDFKPLNDKEEHNISPENIIVVPLRPLNQPSVVADANAISESIMLQLSERNEMVKIVSEADWQLALNERLQNGSNGGGYDFVNKVNDIMVSGWLWQEGEQKKYIFKASDIFTGEVLGSKSCSGKIDEVAVALNDWLSSLKLRKHQVVGKNERKLNTYSDWINNRPLSQYGRFVRYEPSNAAALQGDTSSVADIYVLAEKNWSDGYKDKAIALIEKEWKEKKSTRSASVLIRYYSDRCRNREALVLCNTLMERDDCPEWVVSSFNRLRKKGSNRGAEVRNVEVTDNTTSKDDDFVSDSDDKSQNPIRNNQDGLRVKVVKHGNVIEGETNMAGGTKVKMVLTEKSMDYMGEFTMKSTADDDEFRTMQFRWMVDNSQSTFEPAFFIDREVCGAEWGPGSPCITNRLAFNLPGDVLSQGVYNEMVSKYGIWYKGLLRRYPRGNDSGEIMDLIRFEKNYRSYAERSKNVPKVWVVDDAELARSKRETARRDKEYKHSVVILAAGWNSINPFSESLPAEMQFVRLAYLFQAYTQSTWCPLYDVSYVRAIMELKKYPEIKVPDFMYYDPDDVKVHHSQLRKGGDLINSFVNQIKDEKEDKHRYVLMKLTQILAMDYMSQFGNSRARQLYGKVMNRKIPKNREEFLKGDRSEPFLVYMAGKKNQAAREVLKNQWNNYGSPSYEEAADYLYYLAACGDIELVALILEKSNSSCNPKQLRWAPPEVLHALLTQHAEAFDRDSFYYLILGTKDAEAARNVFQSDLFDKNEFLVQFYGRPPDEIPDVIQEELGRYKKTEAKK